MHPALSVILFTTASGAGYGLLFLIGLLTGTGFLPESRWFAVAAFGLSLGAISFGLLASTFHLGRPERAWRAFSQWRTSWLSREGVASVIAYLPAGLLAMQAGAGEMHRAALAAFAGLEAVDAVEPDAQGIRSIRIEIGQRRHMPAAVPFLAIDCAGMTSHADVEIDDEAELPGARRGQAGHRAVSRRPRKRAP